MSNPITPLLNYSITTSPNPLQVSSERTSTPGTLTVTVSAPGNQDVYCDQIRIYLPLGDNKHSLCTDTPTVEVDNDNWVAATPAQLLETPAAPVDSNADSSAPYIFNNNGNSLFDYELVFIFNIQQVSSKVGKALITISEHSSNSNSTDSYEWRSKRKLVSKSEMEFYLKNFISANHSAVAGTDPIANFQNGDEILLSWDSNATSYTITPDDAIEPVYNGTDHQCTLSGLSKNTTFILTATTVTNSQTNYLYESLTITISNPDLTPNTITVTGSTQVGGDLSVTGATQLGDDDSSLTGAGDLSVSGTTQLSGDLSVTGAAQLGGVDINGALTVNNTVEIVNINKVSEIVSISSHEDVSSTTTYVAATDGFLLGQIEKPVDEGDTCGYYMKLNVDFDGISYHALQLGGNVDGVGSGKSTQNPTSAMVPVPKGATFSAIFASGTHDNDTTATLRAWFIPMGSNGADAVYN